MTREGAGDDEKREVGPNAVADNLTDDNGDAMTKPIGRSHPWQVLSTAGEKQEVEIGDAEKSLTTRSARSDSDSGRRTTAADEIPIEMGPVETHATADSRVPFGPGPERTNPGVVESGTATGLTVEYKVYKRRWFGLVQLALLNIMVSWDWLTFSPVAGEAATYFNTSETTINWLSTAFFFAFCFATPVVIYVLHLGPKLSIATSAALLLVGNWLRYAGAHSSSGGIFGLVMFGQILTGFSQCFVLAAPTCYSDLWFTHRGRVAATALTSLANPFGAALGQLIVPFWVNQASDIPNMVLYVSIIATVCALPSFFIPARPPTPAAPSNETPKLSLAASARILFNQLEFWLLFVPFAIYVGLFNSTSSLLNQILEPHGYSDTDAGIAGALLIVVGLVAAAATSPIIDRTKSYLLAIRVAVPLIGLCYLVFVWMPGTRGSGGVAGPYVVLSVLGAASFSLVPVVVEYLVELTHPISPAVTSTLAWGGGQLMGGVFVVISGALRGGDDADPPGDMRNALVFGAVLAMVAVVPPMCLGLFGRKERLLLRRVRSDEEGRERRMTGEAK